MTQARKSFTSGRALAKMSVCLVYEISCQGISPPKTALYPCCLPLGMFCKDQEPLLLSNRNSILIT